VAGGTLRIYVSVPRQLSPEGQDVLAAEQLALRDSGGQVGKYRLQLKEWNGRELSDNARQAIGDASTIAYLGEIAPGDSGDTLGITNAQTVLQVTPTDTALELTQHSGAIPNSPNRYYESLSAHGRTFARVVPTDGVEVKALVAQMQAVGVTRLYLAGDGSAYSRALAQAVHTGAGSIGFASSPSAADGVLYTGTSIAGATQVLNQAAAGNAKVKLFASSAVAQDKLAAALSPAAARAVYVSEPGFTARALSPQGRQFESAFRAAFGRAPATPAIFGYEAMQAVLHVLQEAGNSAGNRNTVVKDFFAIRNRTSVLGTYSIDKNGDPTFSTATPFVISRVKDGRLVPYRQG
jgi:branched-chain amino acid transport system substrate-binding protein